MSRCWKFLVEIPQTVTATGRRERRMGLRRMTGRLESQTILNSGTVILSILFGLLLYIDPDLAHPQSRFHRSRASFPSIQFTVRRKCISEFRPPCQYFPRHVRFRYPPRIYPWYMVNARIGSPTIVCRCDRKGGEVKVEPTLQTV